MIVLWWLLSLLTDPRQGLAMAYHYPGDLTTLQASWYYQWGSNPSLLSDPRYVPMSRCGEDPKLPYGYSGYLMVFNEPSNVEPYGCGITPEVAIAKYRELSGKYPEAKFVVGGVSAWDSVWYGTWLNDFRYLCQCQPYAWHIHGYIEPGITLDALKYFWGNHIARLGRVWITETGDTYGRPETLRELIRYLQSTSGIERYAIFTNRARGDEPWYPAGWNVQLIDQAGNITNLGRGMVKSYYWLPQISGVNRAYPVR